MNQAAVLEPRTGHLLGPLRRLPNANGWSADLRVDQNDPFFFDHPLDHVPGMLMVCGIVELGRASAATTTAGRVRVATAFRRICLLDPDPVVHLDATGAVRVMQGSTLVADGSFGTSDEEVAVPAAGSAGFRSLPADASLVHRDRKENVLIGELVPAPGRLSAAVLTPPTGHTLDGRHENDDTRTYRVEALLEAGRQLCTLLPHRYGGWPLDVQMLWLGVTADLPAALPRDLPVALRWREAPIPDRKATFTLDLVVGDGDGPALGSLRYTSMSMRRSEYARLRDGQGGEV